MKKFRLVWQLLNRYDNIYLLHPNNLNLFVAACCNASNKQFLTTYKRKAYQDIFYLTASGVVSHEKKHANGRELLKAGRSLFYQRELSYARNPPALAAGHAAGGDFFRSGRKDRV
ncbi:hypothetical protein OJE16_22770 [Pantoea tagorei]